jgi:hypothetical protein
MSDAVGTMQVPAVATPLVTQRAGERHPGPDDVSHGAPSAAKALHVPVERVGRVGHP